LDFLEQHDCVARAQGNVEGFARFTVTVPKLGCDTLKRVIAPGEWFGAHLFEASLG
jgi:hypothetical protein